MSTLFKLAYSYFVFLCSQDTKSKKTKNKKGEVTEGKKKAKNEPEDKWKWWLIFWLTYMLKSITWACTCLLVGQSFKLSLSCNFRWEEERYTDGVKWKFLEHKGPVFAPQYEPLPSHVKFYYDGEFKEWVKSEMKIPVADQLLNNR